MPRTVRTSLARIIAWLVKEFQLGTVIVPAVERRVASSMSRSSENNLLKHDIRQHTFMRCGTRVRSTIQTSTRAHQMHGITSGTKYRVYKR